MTTWFSAALLFGLDAHSGVEDALTGLEPDPAQVSLHMADENALRPHAREAVLQWLASL